MEPSTIFAGISAVSSIVGGIFGASSASSANAKAEKAQKEQQKLLNKQAKLQNKYNKERFEADKENYYKQAEYNFETALENWRYNTAIRALQEKTDMQAYLANVENSKKQLTFNEIAEQQALSTEQLAMNDARAAYAFDKQDVLVQSLISQGKARLGQAGRGMAKRMQSEEAQIGRDLAVLSASLTGEINASNLRMFDVRLGKYAADARVEAARMLMPEKLPDIPSPTKPPEPTWVEPMKVLPGMATPYIPQSVAAPIIAGIGAAAGTLAKVDWNTGSSNDLSKFQFPSGGSSMSGTLMSGFVPSQSATGISLI